MEYRCAGFDLSVEPVTLTTVRILINGYKQGSARLTSKGWSVTLRKGDLQRVSRCHHLDDLLEKRFKEVMASNDPRINRMYEIAMDRI